MTPDQPLAAALDVLVACDLDALLVSSDANRRYLSGFTARDGAPDESAGVIVISRERAVLYVGGNEREWAESESNGLEVVVWERPWTKFVGTRLGDSGARRIGFEDRALVVAFRDGLAEHAPGAAWVGLGTALDEIRALKRPEEVSKLRQAIAATDRAYEEMLAEVQAGMTEKQVGWLIERLSREGGGDVAFDPIVASGPHAARPHHGVTARQIQPGEPVIVDMGVAIDGYNGDLTRTFWLGEAPDRLREVYNAVDRAHAAALAEIRPGQQAKAVDQAARDVLSAGGFGDCIVHSVGHGLGLRVHEAPSISIHSDDVLLPGHVFTIEPGAYLPDWGGVRIEDVVVVTEDGYRVLSAAPKMAGDAG